MTRLNARANAASERYGVFSEVLVDANAGVADGMRQALGRAPRDFTQYAHDVAATGAWGRPLAA